MKTPKRPYYSTRDLLMMAALAALGGVSSTYINALGDAIQSVVGFAGTTQWAAGLHVVWLVLAAGLTGKQGAGTVTGVLKGAVELLSGNTHGLLVVLVDISAGLAVDIGLLPFRRRESLPAYSLAGGLAAASNVFVFQLFASLPADVLAYGALLLIGAVAFASGALFGGGLGFVLLNALRHSGVVRDRQAQPMDRRIYGLFLLAVLIVAGGLTVYLRAVQRGAIQVSVHGAVANPYAFPDSSLRLEQITVEASLRGAVARYSGYPLAEIIHYAAPEPEAEKLLLRAADGYAFFINMAELRDNPSLLLAPQGSGREASYDIVGPQSSKAWVRGVSELVVIGTATLPLQGALGEPRPFDPDEWVEDMDSTDLNLPDVPGKYQGVPLGAVLAAMTPTPQASQVLVQVPEGDPLALELAEVLADEDLRLFTIIGADTVQFAIARMSGEVLAYPVLQIEVQ